MSVVHVENFPRSGDAASIREFFAGLAIPDGGVHILGGPNGDAFVVFSTPADSVNSMLMNGRRIHGVAVKLKSSTKEEMASYIRSNGIQDHPDSRESGHTGPGYQDSYRQTRFNYSYTTPYGKSEEPATYDYSHKSRNVTSPSSYYGQPQEPSLDVRPDFSKPPVTNFTSPPAMFSYPPTTYGSQTSSYQDRPPLGFSDTSTQGFAHTNQGFSDTTRGFADSTRGFSDSTRGFTDNSRGFTDNSRGFTDTPRGFTDTPRGFTDTARGFTDTARSFTETRPTSIADTTPGFAGNTRGFSDTTRGVTDTTRRINTHTDQYQKAAQPAPTYSDYDNYKPNDNRYTSYGNKPEQTNRYNKSLPPKSDSTPTTDSRYRPYSGKDSRRKDDPPAKARGGVRENLTPIKAEEKTTPAVKSKPDKLRSKPVNQDAVKGGTVEDINPFSCCVYVTNFPIYMTKADIRNKFFGECKFSPGGLKLITDASVGSKSAYGQFYSHWVNGKSLVLQQ